MIGSIIGDIVGSFWEFKDEKVHDGELFLKESVFTDDTVLTIASAEAILRNQSYTQTYQMYCRQHPTHGYGPSFLEWAHTSQNYIRENNSWGNGGSMRVSPIGWAFDSPQRVMMEAQQSASITHCDPSGIKGAQATALAVYMARKGHSKAEIIDVMENWFEYDCVLDLDLLHREYTFDVSSHGTVPVALACALQADSFEQVMRNGLYVGGDVDTLLAIAGGIAEPLYGVPEKFRRKAEAIVGSYSPVFLAFIHEFEAKYGAGKTIQEKQTSGSLFDTLLDVFGRKKT